jgi:hypothetical protein
MERRVTRTAVGTASRYLWTVVVLLWLLAPTPASAQAGGLLETKAEYLYRSLRYVTWPREAFRHRTEPVVIGVLGSKEFASFLRGRIGQREVQGRGLSVRALEPEDPLTGIHVLFVSGSLRDSLSQVLAAVPGPVFIVTEVKGALEQGSALNFIESDKRLAFEVNPGAAKERSLDISAALLQPAARVLDPAARDSRPKPP